jgi:hypothetical protein
MVGRLPGLIAGLGCFSKKNVGECFGMMPVVKRCIPHGSILAASLGFPKQPGPALPIFSWSKRYEPIETLLLPFVPHWPLVSVKAMVSTGKLQQLCRYLFLQQSFKEHLAVGNWHDGVI